MCFNVCIRITFLTTGIDSIVRYYDLLVISLNMFSMLVLLNHKEENHNLTVESAVSHLQPNLFVYSYIYQLKFKFSILNLVIILGFFHRNLFFSICF